MVPELHFHFTNFSDGELGFLTVLSNNHQANGLAIFPPILDLLSEQLRPHCHPTFALLGECDVLIVALLVVSSATFSSGVVYLFILNNNQFTTRRGTNGLTNLGVNTPLVTAYRT